MICIVYAMSSRTGLLLLHLCLIPSCAFGKINLVHVDIQGAELELLLQSQLLRNIQHLHIGTHTSIVLRHSRAWLVSHGFSVDFDYAPRSFVSTPYGPVVFDDGVLAARQRDRPDSHGHG